ncbi:hypothetical protein B0H19DRAFT_1061671 [Mycena capillaripes]|nr:hypothetical protein B0H19DRAFT_1061671 [Mycena capillaripes]
MYKVVIPVHAPRKDRICEKKDEWKNSPVNPTKTWCTVSLKKDAGFCLSVRKNVHSEVGKAGDWRGIGDADDSIQEQFHPWKSHRLKVPGMNSLCHHYQLRDGYRLRACGDFKDGTDPKHKNKTKREIGEDVLGWVRYAARQFTRWERAALLHKGSFTSNLDRIVALPCGRAESPRRKMIDSDSSPYKGS